MPETNREHGNPRKNKQRNYSDKEKATILAAYAASGNNLSQTSKIFNVNINTLRSWVKGYQGINEDIQKDATDKKEEIARKLEQFALLAIEDVIAKVEDGKGGAPGSLLIGIGIALDKMQLLRGDVTDRTELKLGDVLERIKARAAKGAGKDGGGKAQAPDKPINPPCS